jgi:uncharacterized YigZ family protein
VSLRLAGEVEYSLEIKRSRFRCRAAQVTDAEAAMDYLRSAGDAAATHNCWAYRIGDSYRSSDDGEPAGTAGRPILAAIDGHGLDAVVAVVTRWYGGIKLGAGGLVRAYGGCAAECLRNAPKITVEVRQRARLHCSFDDLGSVHALLAQHQAEKHSEQFDVDGATLEIDAPASLMAPLADGLREASRGRIELETLD